MHDGYESVDSVWIDPAEAIAGADSGKYTIIFPTLRNIEKLATWSTPEAAVEAAKINHAHSRIALD